MSTYPHVRDSRSTPAISFCACGASATGGPASWGDDCPRLMLEVLTETKADLAALRIEHAACGAIIDATRAARDEARAEVAAYKVRVDGIEAERVIAVDAFYRIRRNRDDVAAEARAEADALRVRVAELEQLCTERDTWRMLGTALADHLCAHNDFTHPNVVTVVKAIARFVQDKWLTSTTPITIEAPHCTHPNAERAVPSTETEMG